MDRGARTPPHYAALEDRSDDVRRIIPNGAEVDAFDAAGLTPFP
jgi:hypothetical protein